jgi:LAO/AO transport system kinase
MYDLAGDSGVFIRVLANRGQYGGLAATTLDAAMSDAGCGLWDGVARDSRCGSKRCSGGRYVADTVLLVEAPGTGLTEVQSIKAGLLEVADALVSQQKATVPTPRLPWKNWRVR